MPAITFANRHVGDYDDSRPADSRGAPWVFTEPQRLRRLAFPTSFPEAVLTGADYWSSLLPSWPAKAAIPGLNGLDAFSAAKQFGGDLFGGFAFEGGVEEACAIDWKVIADAGEAWSAGEGGWIPGLRALLPGASLKIPVVMKSDQPGAPDARHASTHIIRFGPPGDVVRSHLRLLNEAVIMSAARRMALPAVQTRLYRSPWALAVSRFDRSVTGRGQVIRKQALNARQLIEILGEGSQGDKDLGLPAVFRLIEAVSSRPAVDKLQLIRQLIFNQLTGVEEFDAGAVAFLVTASSIHMAPAYGLASAPASSAGAFRIGSAQGFDWMRADHWARLAEEAEVAPGLVFTEIRRAADRIGSAVSDAVREHCKGRLEMDLGSGLVAAVSKRVNRCAEFVLLAQHQKVPRIKVKRAPTKLPVASQPSHRLGGDDYGHEEPIYE